MNCKISDLQFNNSLNKDKSKLSPYRSIQFVLLIILTCFLSGCFANSNKNMEDEVLVLLSGWGKQTVGKIHLDSLNITDPFILADKATNLYYLTGSGGLLWKSPDLKFWEGPYSYIEINPSSWMGPDPKIWAPELHFYKGKYYCFTTFTNTNLVVDTVPGRYAVLRRGTNILISDKAEGPYRPINDEIYLSEKWSTLDGTLWEEEGIPYMVFNHDWMQLIDRQIKYIPLSTDLSQVTGEPLTLFSASDAPWPREMRSIGELTFGMSLNGYVSDGPFLFKTETGRLGMLWSSWSYKRYAQGVAYSESGLLKGPWIQEDKPIVEENSGHGMLFDTFEGKTLLLLHKQDLGDNPGPRKPIFYEVDLSGDSLKINKRYYP